MLAYKLSVAYSMAMAELLRILWEIINSNFFIAGVTFVVGFVAYRVYAKQKRDAKRDAANIILLEIEDAERQLEKVNVDRPFTGADEDDVYLMKSASWDEYKYLFVRDFDRNEWDKITAFYTRCQAYDQSVSFNKKSREHNQREVRVNLQRILADHAKKYIDDGLKDAATTVGENAQLRTQVYEAVREAYIELLVGDKSSIFTYTPMQSEKEAKRALGAIETSLSLTSVGTKLKDMVNKASRFEKAGQLFSRKP